MRDMPRCWVVGPIAWDWPYLVPHLPSSGAFVQAERLPGRLGGTGANVARALVSRHPLVAMIGYVGDDRHGSASEGDLRFRGINIDHIVTVAAATSEVLLFIEPTGERTILGCVPDLLDRVTVPVQAFTRRDVAYFAAWRSSFQHAVIDAAAAGVVVASVPFAKPTVALPVSHIIGSRSEMPAAALDDPWERYQAWTGGVVQHVTITSGANGATTFSRLGARKFPAVTAKVRDATGSGDAFAAAMLAAIVERRPTASGILDGLLWGAATAASEGSIPPAWHEVQHFRP